MAQEAGAVRGRWCVCVREGGGGGVVREAINSFPSRFTSVTRASLYSRPRHTSSAQRVSFESHQLVQSMCV